MRRIVILFTKKMAMGIFQGISLDSCCHFETFGPSGDGHDSAGDKLLRLISQRAGGDVLVLGGGREGRG